MSERLYPKLMSQFSIDRLDYADLEFGIGVGDLIYFESEAYQLILLITKNNQEKRKLDYLILLCMQWNEFDEHSSCKHLKNVSYSTIIDSRINLFKLLAKAE